MKPIADLQNALPLVERLSPQFDACEVFQQLADLPHVVFFDSAMRHPKLGRYSFVAADPVEWLVVPADGSDALATLSERLSQFQTNSRPGLPPFQGGWAGMFGYELGCSLESIPPAAIDEFKLPAMAVGLYDVVIAFDNQQHETWLISQGLPEIDLAARRERATARLAQFRERLSRPSFIVIQNGQCEPLAATALAPQFAIPGHVDLTSNFSADNYYATIQRAIDYIHAGDVFQVNLSQRLLHAACTSSVELYCRLRERNPAPFAGYLDGGNWQIASASPERFVRVDGRQV